MKHSTTAYRIDIEGLRALAVLAVILNHARDGLLNSGYLGVDIFFVISGYVITASLQTSRDVPIGAFLLAFYTRRIKRITPALILCVGISSAALLLCDPDPAVSFKTGIFALLGLANVYLYLEQINYFASDTAFNAFMHTWSLGVEEQFYLILPVLIVLVRPARRLAGLVLALSALSLLAFILLHQSDPQGSFYLIHTRFWELGAGAAFAALGFARRKTVARSGLMTWQTACLVVVIAFLAIRGIDQRLSTLIIVASTLAVIGSPDRSVLLTNPVAKAIGRLSYSLYLWHWPLLVLLRLSQETHWVIWPIYVVGVLGAALLSFHLVENPLRHRTWSRHAGASLIYGGLASGAMIGALYGGLATLTQSNTPRLQSEAGKAYWEQPFLQSPSGKPHFSTCVVADPDLPWRAETFADCTFPPKPDSHAPMVWVMGDSHSGHYQGLMVQLHEDYGVGFHLVETPGHAFPDVVSDPPYEGRKKLYAEVKKQLSAGDTVFLARLFLNRADPVTPLYDVETWLPAFEDYAAEMQAMNVQVIVAAPTPMYQFTDIRSCVRADPASCATPRAGLEGPVRQIEARLDAIAARHANVRVLKLFDLLCPAGQTLCSPKLDNIFTMRDRDHMTLFGAVQAKSQMLQFLGLPAKPPA